jgi:hypothetical protein
MIKIGDNSATPGGLGVNSDHEAQIAPTRDVSKVGLVALVTENNPAGVGAGRSTRQITASLEKRLRAGSDAVLFSDVFNHGNMNTSKYKCVTATMTMALTGNRWVLNNGNSVTAAQSAQFSTWAFFRLNPGFQLSSEFAMTLAVSPQQNNVIEIGNFIASGVAAPTDGVFFRYNALGILLGVVNVNGAESLIDISAAGFVPTPGERNRYAIAWGIDRAEFWIDGKLWGSLAVPATSLSLSLPLAARLYNPGAVTTAQRAEISSVAVISNDHANNKLWATINAIQGNSSINAPDSAGAGYTQNYANSAAPATGTLSNTAAAYATLGGQFQFAAPAGAETDFVLFGYQVPAATAAAPGRNLVIRGIRIESFNMGAAVATTPTLLQWAIGVGASAVSAATTDNATNGTRGGRRFALGIQSIPIGAAPGQAAAPVDVNLDAPVVVEPGCFVQILVKVPIGTATASQIVRGLVSVNGFFE